MIKVLATGTFEILHPGHLTYLKKAKELGDELIVIVARDSNIKHKRKPMIPEKQRLEMVKSLKPVDKAILGSETDIFAPLKDIKPDIIALGHDQHFDVDMLVTQLRHRGIMAAVVRIGEFNSCKLCSSGGIMEEVRRRFVDKS
ncbi:MAG: FAD synthase [Methanosarcinales archaeon Met12]|nr:MAG: FAD synthase [Methanosarcinales archaeon Met12]